jgi:excinuclease UvrABC nuclease subunit
VGHIEYEYTLPPCGADGFGVVYVGRSTNLGQRWRGHFTRGERKDGGQVKFGIFDSGIQSDHDEALRVLREHARVVYTVLPGDEHCANRDILELSLCARLAPPFNIKSER